MAKKTLSSINKKTFNCFCKGPCFRYEEGHCGGTEYEYHHCEQLLEEGKEQRKRFNMNLVDRNNY